MVVQRKEIFALKRNLDLYLKCYADFGYQTISKTEHYSEYEVVMEHCGEPLSTQQHEHLRQIEHSLRFVEVLERKRRGFRQLFVNLLFHVLLLCVQSVIFMQMSFDATHPKTMLGVGILLLQIILVLGICMELRSAFRWTASQRRYKQNALRLPVRENVENEEKVYCISVLFTRGNGKISDLIYYTTGRRYTHSAIGLGMDTDTFYSFDYRGFRIEHPAHRKLCKGKKDSLCYQLRVSENEYKEIQNTIEKCIFQKDSLCYNLAGAICSILHIYSPFKKHGQYFCSEFVSELLLTVCDIKLHRSPRMYFPNNLAKALCCQSNLYRVLVNEI